MPCIILKLLDILSWGEAEKIASKISKKLLARKNLNWLNKDCLNNEINNEIKLKSKSLEKVKRLLAHKISKNLLKKSAKSLGAELDSLVCEEDNTFIIHSYMNPWVLIDEHTSHIKDPIKNYPLWDTHKHRDWCESIIDENELIMDLITKFEQEFSEEFESGIITRLKVTSDPVNASLYKVNKN